MLQDEFVLFYKNGYDNIDIINNNFIKLQLSKILFFFNLGQEQVLDYLLLVKVLLFENYIILMYLDVFKGVWVIYLFIYFL